MKTFRSHALICAGTGCVSNKSLQVRTALEEELKKCGVSVVRAGEDRLIESVSVVLVGHVLHSDLGDTIDRIDTTGYAEVMDLSLSMTGINEPSSAYLKIRATGKAEIQKALSILRDVGKEKKLLVIEPIETEAI